jgi:hypothetical protein
MERLMFHATICYTELISSRNFCEKLRQYWDEIRLRIMMGEVRKFREEWTGPRPSA